MWAAASPCGRKHPELPRCCRLCPKESRGTEGSKGCSLTTPEGKIALISKPKLLRGQRLCPGGS